MSSAKTTHLLIALLVLLGLCLFNSRQAIAAEGKARVYKIDPETTPSPMLVTLNDLDTSGFLSGPFLALSIKSLSHYDYPAYSPQYQFLYQPTPWNYYNIWAEGLKFDQASVYYYYTLARKYFETRFGFRQALDEYHIDPLSVILFHEAADGPVKEVIEGINPRACIVIMGVPGDPGTNPLSDFFSNANRAFSKPMHEYTHFVFLRYRQRLQFQEDNPQAVAINEGLAMFWPCTIMDEPSYNRSFWPPQMSEKLTDLRNSVQYNPQDTTTDDQEHGTNRNKILSLATALWKLREHPRIGKTNAEKIIYNAMALIPHRNATLADVSGACSLAKASLPAQVSANLYQHIEGVFAKHNISKKIGSQISIFNFLEVGNTLPETMQVGETKVVAIVFENQASSPAQAPSLVSLNPIVNPNADNPGLLTKYTWDIINPINPQSPATVPPGEGDKVVFSFSIKAPLVPGKYACDWAIKLADGTTSYIVSKDITVTK